ncbi:MAG: hypothetical protein R2865_14875 [Deinococcales bacterium]
MGMGLISKASLDLEAELSLKDDLAETKPSKEAFEESFEKPIYVYSQSGDEESVSLNLEDEAIDIDTEPSPLEEDGIDAATLEDSPTQGFESPKDVFAHKPHRAIELEEEVLSNTVRLQQVGLLLVR